LVRNMADRKRHVRAALGGWVCVAFSLALWGAAGRARAQEVTPPTITLTPTSLVCSGGAVKGAACITLPAKSIISQVDVFLLFDDTGIFEANVPEVTQIFSGLVAQLERALPDVEFGFGVGRFEDYGGPGTGFSTEFESGRPFILNQPIVTAADAGGPTARNDLIGAALQRTAPGFGGDGPESAIEALHQIADGAGFDGDGDGLTTGVGGGQPAGALVTQTDLDESGKPDPSRGPDTSGDVPAFSTLIPEVVRSGKLGGAGFRPTALKLVIVATDTCSVAAFDPVLGIPEMVSGAGGVVPSSDFACEPRFGYVSDAKELAKNTVDGTVVAPSGAATVPDTVAALNEAGIRVLGMVDSGESASGRPFLSALALLTGAVDAGGKPLVFDITDVGTSLRDAIVNAIITTATQPVDVELLSEGPVPPGLSVAVVPDVVPGVEPGAQACFDVTFSGSGSPNGQFVLGFHDRGSGAELAGIPTAVECVTATTTTSTSTTTSTTAPPSPCLGKDCSDGNPCTEDRCDPADGSCSHPPVVAGTACDDGDSCTDGDSCQAGLCVGGASQCHVGVLDDNLPARKPMKAMVEADPGSQCEAALFELVPVATSAAAPSGFQVGRQFSKRVRKRVKKRGRNAGRVVIKLRLNKAATKTLKTSSTGQLPVLARFTITGGGIRRIVDQPLTFVRGKRSRAGIRLEVR
jgi:hypothetical protein